MSEFEKELAKAAGGILTESARDARKALGSLFGDAAYELAKMMGESVRLWRLKNLMRISVEVRRISEERGIPVEQLRALPMPEALRVAEAASLEDEPELQAMWAGLIATATAPGECGSINRAFIGVLASLSPADAAMLNYLRSIEYLEGLGGYEGECCMDAELKRAKSVRWNEYDEQVRGIAVQNLFRMRCIAMRAPYMNYHNTFPSEASHSDKEFGDFSAIDTSRLRKLVESLHEYMTISAGGTPPSTSLFIPELMYQFTPLGRGLVDACIGETKRP